MTRRRTWKKLWFWKGPMTWRSRQRETAGSDTLFCTTAVLYVWGFCRSLGRKRASLPFHFSLELEQNPYKEVIKMLQDFIMNSRCNWSNRGFAIILASHNRSLHYLEAVCKFLLSILRYVSCHFGFPNTCLPLCGITLTGEITTNFCLPNGQDYCSSTVEETRWYSAWAGKEDVPPNFVVGTETSK